MGDTDRPSDLARIRENQRRSRARRKEYLQDLERKWRRCEKFGIEASVEIQVAAKKVLEENLRLRALLMRNGVSLDDEGPRSTSDVAADLDSLFGANRRCGDSCGLKQQQQQQRTSSASLSPWPTQRSPLSSNENTCSTLLLPPSYPPSSGPCTGTNSTSPANWSTVSDPTAYNDQYDLPPSQLNDASSCRDVADAIRYIRPGVGDELESEMGCQDGNYCEIPATRAFDLMDRFSSDDLGGSRRQ
ncbi:uncharacterized protein MYCFIDRAFT_167957 [Pseudocercospora fijiensis CIRAD86]|uniref:BZIP domain-containing protein n=1 Tax=Pseudocercospora fijiensis (strain CIRAD86) TaxID=383855 RepID=M3A2J3_PSEFD|nr:uncharacterized protein MYCFIDRAFT_167957 [Pseudocercospora fijiensis CIRAD86]EME78611.1 hypothetical protein MYCFIDRAFT_167957 [Pseudocercospora fijiensis CIRAD86]